MPKTLTAVPAYGRDYKNARAVREDWAAGKDFLIRTYGPDDGRYINKQDADAGGVTVHLRYKNLTQIVVIKPNSDPLAPKGVPRKRRPKGWVVRADYRWRDPIRMGRGVVGRWVTPFATKADAQYRVNLIRKAARQVPTLTEDYFGLPLSFSKLTLEPITD